MSQKISPKTACSYFRTYHGNPSQPKLRNVTNVIDLMIIEGADIEHLKKKAGANYYGIAAVPAHNTVTKSDTIILVALTRDPKTGEIDLVLPASDPNSTDYIVDDTLVGPPYNMGNNFNRLHLIDWGC